MQIFKKSKTLIFLSVFVFCTLTIASCKKEEENNNTTNNKVTQGQISGNWKLVKEHWQLSNNQDMVLTSWSTNSGDAIPPTIEFGTQILGSWFSGGMDRMSWGGPIIDPTTRGSDGANALWQIEASTNLLIGAAYSKYKVVYIDANNMILSQENVSVNDSYDTLWLERL
jgi:hypothetical protein